MRTVRIRPAAKAAAVALPAAVLLGLSGTAGAAPAEMPQQQVAAVAEAGTVYVSGTWSGYVGYPGDNGVQWSPLLSANYSCSGFVASSDGYIVTAGHCADVAEGKKMLVDEFLNELVQNGAITQADAQTLISQGAEDDLPVEGRQAGSPPVLATKVYPAIAIGGTGNDQGYEATLVDDRPLSQGDVALLKVDAPTPLPVLQVASTAPAAGDTVDAIGYPGDVTQLVTDSVQPTFAKGQVSGRQQTQAGPFTQIGVSMSAGMSGGPVVNTQGQVVGTVSFGPSDDTQQLNFASTEDNVQALLSRNGVKNTLTPTDQTYRKALTEYFAGQYHAAAQDFGTVLSSAPNQALAQQYKAKAIDNFPNERPAPVSVKKSSSHTLIYAGAGGGALVLAVGAALLVILRRKRRPAPTAAAPISVPAPMWAAASPAPEEAESVPAKL